MEIQNITGTNAIPKGSLENSREYVKSTTEDQDQTPLEKIRDDNKGNKIDTTA